MKFYSKYKTFDSRKCNCKYCLKWRPLCPVGDELITKSWSNQYYNQFSDSKQELVSFQKPRYPTLNISEDKQNSVMSVTFLPEAYAPQPPVSVAVLLPAVNAQLPAPSLVQPEVASPPLSATAQPVAVDARPLPAHVSVPTSLLAHVAHAPENGRNSMKIFQNSHKLISVAFSLRIGFKSYAKSDGPFFLNIGLTSPHRWPHQSIKLIQLISPWTKWLPFRRRYFQMHFSWMKIFQFWLKFHWSLFLNVQLPRSQHWFR